MAVEVSLWTWKHGELKKFLERYYQRSMNMEEDVDKWVYVYHKPLDAVDIISAVIDNNDQYQISICIKIDKGDVYPVTPENYNNIIKDMFCLFYKDSAI